MSSVETTQVEASSQLEYDDQANGAHTTVTTTHAVRNKPKSDTISTTTASHSYKYIDWDSRTPSVAERNTKLHPSQRRYFPSFESIDANTSSMAMPDASGTGTAIVPVTTDASTNEPGVQDSPTTTKVRETDTFDDLPREMRPLYQQYTKLYTQSRDPRYDPTFTLDPTLAALEQGWDDRAGPSAAHLSTLMHTYHHHLRTADCPSTLAGPRSFITVAESVAPPSAQSASAASSSRPATLHRPARLVAKGRNPAIERCKAVVRMYLNEAGGQVAKLRGDHKLHKQTNEPTGASATSLLRSKRSSSTGSHFKSHVHPASPSQPRPLASAGYATLQPLQHTSQQQPAHISTDSSNPSSLDATSNNSADLTTNPDEKGELVFELVLPAPRSVSQPTSSYNRSQPIKDQTSRTHEFTPTFGTSHHHQQEMSSNGTPNSQTSKITMVPKLPKLPKVTPLEQGTTTGRPAHPPTTNAKATKDILNRLEENERKKHWDSTLFGFTATLPGSRPTSRTSTQSPQAMSTAPTTGSTSHAKRDTSSVQPKSRTASPNPVRDTHSTRDASRPHGAHHQSTDEELQTIDRELARIQEERERIKAALLLTSTRK